MKNSNRIVIDRRLCKSCGICAAMCPLGCIASDETGFPSVLYPERCLGCMICERHCPDFAVRMKVEKDE